ncbi:hypothetical protein N7532_003866 [Penicillium argentinense]|uniref:Uncharacterized protein n=1 Tax=Penicillium argentinense TaxID=1131581 RepID=A0A9W9KFL4_9EURO|nr:uncharacterized protein N7532_003866 [Penicillium argentinense]KAJ5103337.1 hypothetical protein N7532_003866 [Penicillium argentinense]
MADHSLMSPAPPKNVQRGDYLFVLHDHFKRNDDELQMMRGNIIRLEEMDEEFQDGWWLGEQPESGQKGLFPAGFTRKAHAHERPRNRGPPDLSSIQTDPSPETVIAFDKTESPAQMEPSTPVDVESSFASAGSEQTTPQASRHASTSDVYGSVDSPKQQRSASSPLPQQSLAADIQQTFRRSIDSHANGEESPVMNETLSVIDEHITDMNTPRHSVSTQEAKTINDSGSEYSSHFSHRLSYINGNETDEEEGVALTEEQVRRWTHTETAKHMRDLGMDTKHCDIFEEQEITGDVLLDMDQDFIFMKEFDFGVMGKRLKTWHKVKAFQEEVRGLKQQQQQQQPPAARASISGYLAGPEERSLSRAGHTGPFLPRIPTVSEKTGAGYVPRVSAVPGQHPRLASNGSSPIAPRTPPYGHDSPRRVSAASIRDLNHTRRHSSIDTTHRGPPDSLMNGHQKKPSFDRAWTLNSGGQGLPARPGTSLGTTAYRGPQTESEPNTPDQIDDLDRGYFSGTEIDSRRTRRVLQKRTSAAGSIGHSRKSSYAEDQYKVKNAGKRQSRIASVDSMRDAARHVSSAADNYHSTPQKSRFRSLSTRVSERSGHDSQDSKAGFFSNLGPFMKKGGDSEGSSARSSTLPWNLPKMGGANSKIRRAVGFRAISDVVGKGTDTSAPVSPRDYDPTTGRTGSTTPSATSKSSERHSTDGSGKATDSAGFMIRPRTVKSKKDTSAYIRGLEKKSPREQMDGCDYSGWMKKRSSNLMTTWKPRLFVLRGRRLSYYYSEDDTEERGLIDITAHRVLRADNDPIIALHATVTGSTAQPANANPSENASGTKVTTSNVLSSLSSKDGSGPFFFKLVPPRSGNSRTVQFTKPTTHYFQVDSVAEVGKDQQTKDNQSKTSSDDEPTPPALMNNPPVTEPDQLPDELVEEADEEEHGLRIEGLNLSKAPSTESNSFVDANAEAPKDESGTTDQPMSNPLGEIDTGHTSLLPSPLAKTESK